LIAPLSPFWGGVGGESSFRSFLFEPSKKDNQRPVKKP
jgi:hypothetical protein